MKSDTIKKGIERAPHRALLHATGIPKSEMGKPFIGVATSFTDLIPGHSGMRDLERFIEKGVHAGGGYRAGIQYQDARHPEADAYRPDRLRAVYA